MSFVFQDDPATAQHAGMVVTSGEFELPRLVLKDQVLRQNIANMNRYCEAAGVALAPHAKTTMSPYVIGLQLESGVWGLTVATLDQLRVCLELGARRILLANELVNPAGIAWIGSVLAQNDAPEIYSLVDSVETVKLLADGLRGSGMRRPYRVLVEFGVPGFRAGCRTFEEAKDVCDAIAAESLLVLAGIEGYEGVIGTTRSADEIDHVDTYLARVVDWTQRLDSMGAFAGVDEVILSAGGSHYFDRVVEILSTTKLGRPKLVVLRSGCYATADHRTYMGEPPRSAAGDPVLTPALELWSEVLSVPEPGLAIAGFGKRDAPYDNRLPIVLGRLSGGALEIEPLSGVTVTKLHDQHAFLDATGCPGLAVGDLLVCGIVHPCTAFDKWRHLAVVDTEYRLIEMADTCF